MYKILVADDEVKIRETIKEYLQAKGFEVTLAVNGAQAVDLAVVHHFDLIILDVMMPVKKGTEACKEIRKHSDTPIIFLSALGEEADFLKGFSSGGDDYITKPFMLSVLHQKALAMIMRYKGLNKNQQLVVSGVTLDIIKHKLITENNEIPLSGKDFELLQYFMENKNIVLDREKILTRIWGWEYDGDSRVVDTRVKRLRHILGPKGNVIKTIVGVGYCFEAIE